MDFFEAEQRARTHTFWLIVLFTLAVAGTVVAVYAVARVSLLYLSLRSAGGIPLHFWDRNLFWKIAAATVTLICGASVYKTRALSGSAESLALGLGGRLLDPNTPDPYERRLLERGGGDGDRLRGARSRRVRPLAGAGDQRLRRRPRRLPLGDRRDRRLAEAALARRAAGRGGARVQPSAERRCEDQPSPPGPGPRNPGDRPDRLRRILRSTGRTDGAAFAAARAPRRPRFSSAARST